MTNDLGLLSERERTVLRLVATGATNQQIADQLDISPNTVKVHLRNIFGKIGAASRTEATMYAVRVGLVEVANGAAMQTAPAQIDVPSSPQMIFPIEPLPLEPEVAEPPFAAEPTTTFEASSKPITVAASQIDPLTAPAVRPDQVLSRRIVGVLGVAIGIILSVAVLLLWQRFLTTPAGFGGVPTVSVPTSGNWVQGKAPGQALNSAAAVNYGPIFVIGGWDGHQVLNSTLRYDPLVDKWTELTDKPTAVRDIQAAVLGGKIFVPGGKLANGQISAGLEIFDPQSKTWSNGKQLPAPRSAYGLAVVEGRLYLFGGWDGSAYRADVFRFDPATDVWDTLTPMPTARAYSCVATDPQGNVFVIGGENSGGALYNNEEYLPANEGGVGGARPWNQRKPLLQPRSRVGCGAVDNEVYLFGGDGDEVTLRYDSRTDMWQNWLRPPHRSARSQQSPTAMVNFTSSVAAAIVAHTTNSTVSKPATASRSRCNSDRRSIDDRQWIVGPQHAAPHRHGSATPPDQKPLAVVSGR